MIGLADMRSLTHASVHVWFVFRFIGTRHNSDLYVFFVAAAAACCFFFVLVGYCVADQP